MRPPGRPKVRREVSHRLRMQIQILDSIVPERIPVPGEIEAVISQGVGHVEIGNAASAITAVRIITAPSYDLGLQGPCIGRGVLIGAGRGRLPTQRAHSQNEWEDKGQQCWDSHRPDPPFVSSACTTSAEVLRKVSVVWMPKALRTISLAAKSA